MAEPGRAILVTDVRGFANPVIAKALRASGARVWGCDPSITADREEDGIGLIAWANPGVVVADAARRAGGALEAIIIAPAMAAPRTPVEALTPDLLRAFFERIAVQALLFASAAATVMRPRKAGRIVFVTSAGPLSGVPGFSAYAAARSAVNGAVKSLALELAPDGISVNAVAPNFIQTETYYPKALLDDPVKGPRLLARVPLGRLGTADEVAALVTTLAMGDVGFVSGQIIPINGASG